MIKNRYLCVFSNFYAIFFLLAFICVSVNCVYKLPCTSISTCAWHQTPPPSHTINTQQHQQPIPSTSHERMLHLLQSVKQGWHPIITGVWGEEWWSRGSPDFVAPNNSHPGKKTQTGRWHDSWRVRGPWQTVTARDLRQGLESNSQQVVSDRFMADTPKWWLQGVWRWRPWWP